MIRFLFFVSTILLLLTASAQQPLLKWAKPFHGNNATNHRDYSNGRTIGVDEKGNVYSAGFFSHTIDFDPGPGVFNLTGGDGGVEQQGTYITKLDSNGNFVWARQIPVYAGFSSIEMKVEKNGTVYLTSTLDGSVDMDPGPGVFTITAIGFQDAYVIKLSPDGELIWAKQFGGIGDTGTSGNVLDIDKDGNVFVSGQFNNTVDFDPGPGVYSLTSTAHMKSYIAKLSGNGNLIWAKQYGQSPSTYGGAIVYDIKCDSKGAIHLAGSFSGVSDFDPGTGVYTLTGKSQNDGFIAHLDADGNFGWAKQFMNTGTDYNSFMSIRGLDVDGMDNVVVIGWFIGTFDLDPGVGVANSSSVGGTDFFVVKLNEQGILRWAKVLPGNEGETGNDLVLDNSNNVYTIGSFGKIIDLDPGPGEFIVNSPFYGAPGLIKLTADGNFVYGVTFPGLEHNSCLFRRMEIDGSRNIYVTGFVGGVVDFDPGLGVFPVSGTQDQSPFVLKLSPCKNSTTSTLNIAACSTYSLNGEDFDSSGTYLRTIRNSTGCDSLITLHLTINSKTSSQAITICEGESFLAGGKKQTQGGIYSDTLQTWQGCDSVVTTTLVVNAAPRPKLGEDRDLCSNEQLTLNPGLFKSYYWHNSTTTKNITIAAAGSYWVEVTNDFNCKASDTIVVRTILPAPVNFLRERDSICGYERLEISPVHTYENYQWSTGETVRSMQVLQPGLYWLSVTDDKGCKGIDSISVYAKQCMLGVYIPTAFTPNADGKNDVFRPMVFGVVKQYGFAVYNRWGKEVFQSKEPGKGWDGKVAGILQPNSVFVWTCTFQLEGGELKTERGTVTLIQ